MNIRNFKAVGLIDKEKRYKLKPLPIIATILTPLIISTSFQLSDKNLEKYNNKVNFSNTETVLAQTPSPVFGYDENNDNEFSSTNASNKTTVDDVPVILDADDTLLKAFEMDIDGIESNYEFSKYYDIEDCLKEYSKSYSYIQNIKHTGTLKKLSADELYKVVMKNNDAEFSKSAYDRGNLYKELDTATIKEICEIIIDTILEQKDSPTFDMNRTLCVLSNLKIVKDAGTMSVAGVNNDLFLAVNPNMVSVFSIMTNNEKADSFKETIAHEAVHLCQIACPDMKKYGEHIGISFETDNVTVNGLSSIWLNEAVAEKKGSEVTGEEVSTYLPQIGYLYAMEASTIFDDDNSEDCICDLTYTNDLNELYRVFNCQTDEEKKEILDMIYSITIQQNGPEDFYAVYPGEEEQDGIAILQRNLRGSIFTTLSKVFYKNLANSIKNNSNVTLQDIFFLIHNFESVVSLKTQYADEVSYERYEQFLNDYVKIQDSFFEFIAESNEMTAQEVTDKFNDYALYSKNMGTSISCDDKRYNCTLKWLSDSKIGEIGKGLTFTEENSTGTIRSVVEKRILTQGKLKK